MRADERALLRAFAQGELLLFAAKRLGISETRLKNVVQKWLDFGYVKDAKLTEEGKAFLRND